MSSEDNKTQIGTSLPGSDTSVDAAKPKTSYLPETKDPLLGTTLAGRYLIARKLGEGGMGTVYLATHTILEKQVALKVLHGEFARKQDLVERFMQEAKAASRIRHENVIDISDFGITPEGHVFFAMELLKGHDLHDEIARARVAGQLLPWSRTKKIFLQICSALAAAHAKGIVHRDLKPENVYLVEFLGDPDFVKLLDFGIAKLTEVNDEGGRKLTKTGMLFGTPEYMSPEQARGEHVDHRVDIYAMGCILFQLVSGRVPFEADNFMGVLSMHLTEPPPIVAPETYDRIGAPRALGDVIDRALIKDRNARYQTIDDLANAVREVSGDVLPADRSQRLRAPSVPAPASTTRARSPTGPAVAGAEAPPMAVATATRVRKAEPTGRQKTQWTGSLRVPEIAVESPRAPARSKLPLVIGALVVLGGGGAAAVYFATRGGGGADVASTPGSGSGSASGSGSGSGSIAAVSGGSAVATPPPEIKLPELSHISFDSKPQGATVTELPSGKVLGKTPMNYSLPGSKTPRQFAFRLHGYGDTTVELVPDRETIVDVETLAKGAVATVHVVSDAKPGAGTGSAMSGSAASGSAASGSAASGETGAVTRPDTTGQPKPDAAEPAAKPCNDEDPCLKGFGSGQ